MWPIINLGFLQIPTFYLIMSLSLTIGLFFISELLETYKEFNRKQAFELMIVVFISGFIGGRLFHVFYEEPSYYFENPIEIFKFWQGGFVYYGGLIAVCISSFFYLKKNRLQFLKWADFLTPVFSLMYSIGRLGCFFEGCCFGKPSDLPWAIHGLHPTQLYMALSEFLLFIFIFIQFKKNKLKPVGKLFFTWVSIHSLTRFIIEFYRNDSRGLNIFQILSISQMISIFLFIFSLALLKKIQLGKF